jgi:integrase
MGKSTGLTVKRLEALAPGTAPYEVKDDAEAGLYAVVWPSGARTFVWRYRFQNKSRKLTLSPVSLAEARKRAREARNLRDDGFDPAQQKRAAKAAQIAVVRQAEREKATVKHDDIETVVASFVERHHKPSNRSWREAAHFLDREIVAPWRGHRLSEITRADIHALLDRIADRPAPVLANRIYAHLRKLCRWAMSRGIIEKNPCDGMSRPSQETSRDRTLDDRELALLWKASERLGWPFEPVVKLLILTGQRKSEISEGHWSEIDLGAGLWSLPLSRVKNKRAHTIPLPAQAVEILESLPRIGDSDLIFTMTGATAISGFTRAKRRLDAAMAALNGGEPIAPWVVHDIRRSVVSGLASIDVQLPVIERIVNHISGSFAGVAGIYQRHQFEPEKRAALGRWANHIERVVTGSGEVKVIKMKGNRI